MLIAHKIALDPTNKQLTYFSQASGVARFAYNWALAEWQKQYQSGGKPTDVSLRRQLNALKRAAYPWMFDVTKCACQEAIIDLGTAFRAFFEKRGAYPRFKRKGVHDSFCAANEAGTFSSDGRRIKLPVIGWIRMFEAVRFSGILKRATISRVADRWFVSIMIETSDIKPLSQAEEAVGVDLGINQLASLSDGTAITGPKAHKALLQRLRRMNKAMARKQRASKNFFKVKQRLARLHARIANIRKDSTHKTTTKLVKTYKIIGIEDLNIRGMVKNRRLARSIMDGGFAEFRRQLEYKSRFYGAKLIIADRFFPSSKKCSCCGTVKTVLDLSQRIFTCSSCDFTCDRDVNAAINLKNLAASSAVTAGGEARSGAVRKNRVKRASLKQEPNTNDQLCA